jgi:hypothetical protein
MTILKTTAQRSRPVNRLPKPQESQDDEGKEWGCVIVDLADEIPSGYLFAEGCDGLVVFPVHLEYGV